MLILRRLCHLLHSFCFPHLVWGRPSLLSTWPMNFICIYSKKSSTLASGTLASDIWISRELYLEDLDKLWFLFDFSTITYHDQLQLSWFCFFFNDALLLQFFNSSLRATVQLSVLVHAVQDLDRPICARSASTSLHSFRSFSSVSGLGQFDASCAIMFTELVTTFASFIYPNCLYRSGLT